MKSTLESEVPRCYTVSFPDYGDILVRVMGLTPDHAAEMAVEILEEKHGKFPVGLGTETIHVVVIGILGFSHFRVSGKAVPSYRATADTSNIANAYIYDIL